MKKLLEKPKYSQFRSSQLNSIFLQLVEKERVQGNEYDYLSGNLHKQITRKDRELIISDMLLYANSIQLSSNTKHLAVVLLDIVLKKTAISRKKAQACQLVCLCIASKFLGDQPIKTTLLRKTEWEKHREFDFNKLEFFVMQLLGWTADYVTPTQVLHTLLGLVMRSEEDSTPIELDVNPIIDFCYTDYTLSLNRPSIIAISAILTCTELKRQEDVRDRFIQKIYRTCDDDYIEKICKCKKFLCNSLASDSKSRSSSVLSSSILN